MTDRTVRLITRRQSTPDAKPYWEEFDLRWRPGMNVITGLMDIAANPVDRFGKPTTPVVYELQLSGGGMRLLCDAHQRAGCHGLFRARG